MDCCSLGKLEVCIKFSVGKERRDHKGRDLLGGIDADRRIML